MKTQLVQAAQLASTDARRRVAEIAADQHAQMWSMLGFALAFGATASFAAWRIAGSLAADPRLGG